ncbi:phosphate ABC transporter permease subunit PstC [Halorarum halophilum]|uniref:Phosphate transport system permease protein n=1 Tax=Halorarum halophilum TaxID=2743090 RepID=A0A7D5KXC2_9EURY|nr:phosphate ABC transporter permease subunit PstC [Halobaculum halophilum]QLG28018.1 phosphate ABC transporter permease subunit PstC [Halobaculum halophilum]
MSNDSHRLQLSGGRRRRATRERLYHWLLFLSASLSVIVTASIVLALAVDAVQFFGMVGPVEFFTGTEWVTARDQFGVLPLVTGTLLVTAVAALVAVPVGVGAAIYLSEYASGRARSVLKPGLEILAGIPTVVYGYLALVYLTPFLRTLGLELGTFNVLSASIMVGIMIVPMVSSLSEDAMSAVPDSLREGGYALGATKYEVSTGVVVPAALSGIFASFILALSRAIGETMIVVMAMGLRPRMFDLADPLGSLSESGQTMTSAMVQAVTSDVSAASPTYKSMFALGLTLFAITFLMNYLSNAIASRYREEYQ